MRNRWRLVTNHVVPAEFSSRFATPDHLLEWVLKLEMQVHPIDHIVAFEAGQAFRADCRAGGLRTAILPDFLIGEHAFLLGATLLTRDPRRFARYFPDLALITPESHP